MARGRLRIYLGAAPGVGKTVSMLHEGARRAERGTDVVVAVVETHDRAMTAAAVGDLEVVPRRVVEHRGTTLAEMDLDAVLERRPQVALVDELAHTNPPGSRHDKRWQDVADLLDAGVDVISTVNIQHLESLNDATAAITGVRQRETVPDAVVRAADQVELVDMSPEALRRRMAHGNVYRPEQVDAALANYFREGNLSALRELALLWLADRVDEGLARYRRAHDIDSSWPTRERVLVALTGGAEGHTLLRRGARIAGRGAGGELLAVHVVRPDGLSTGDPGGVAALHRLTEELGGTLHTVTGDDVAGAVLDFARGVNASQVVVGTSRRSRVSELLSPGVGERVVDESGEIDVHVVIHEETRVRRSRATRRAALSRRRTVAGWLLATAGVLALSLGVEVADAGPDLSLVVLLYLALTVLVAIVGGLWPAVLAALLGSVAINWAFTPPVGTLAIADPQSSLALLIFVAVAVAVSSVVHRGARRTAQAEAARAESEALLGLSRTLLATTDQAAHLLEGAVETFGATGAAVVRRAARPGGGPEAARHDVVVAATDRYRPGRGPEHRERVDDDHDLVLQGPPPPADRQGLLAAWAAHAAAILTRRELDRSTRDQRLLTREAEARTALLSSVSHDLRTPLAGIKAAVGSLRSDEVTFSAEDEAELLAAIEDSSDRLDALVGNLLDVSRLEAGALTVRPGAVDLGALVPAVADHAEGDVTWSVDPAAHGAWGDGGLLERVVANLVENALRHAAGAPVHVGTSALGGRVEIRVVDRGPGVPVDEHDGLFAPFRRRGDVPRGEGVGLGLAVARGLTEAMDGTLTAEDTPGGGLTMVIALPARAPEEET